MTHAVRWRQWAKTPSACNHASRLEGKEPPIDADRVSGLVVCDLCNHEYYAHPRHPSAECLTVLCDGTVVKL